MSYRTFEAAQAAVLERHGVDARSRFVAAPSTGGRAHVLTVGSGPPAIVLNGIGVPGAMWAPLLAELDDLTLHAVDLPAFGLTDTSPDFARDLRRDAVGFLADVLDGLGLDRPIVIANSLGSLWALWFAAAHPERVTALVHVGLPALAAGSSAPLPMRLLSVPGLGPLITRLDPPSTRQVRRLSRMVGEHPLEPEMVDLIVATEQRPDFRRTFLVVLRQLLRLRGARRGLSPTDDDLIRVTQPNLLVLGRDDPMGGEEHGRRFVAALSDAELRTVAGGHAPWLRRADEIAEMISTFLYDRRSMTIAMP